MRAPRRLATALFSSAVLLVLPARAADPDAAKKLFDQGVEDLEAGRLDRACPAIDESYKLDPRPGTLFALAECEAKHGRLAAAVRRYDEYLTVHAALPAEKKRKQADREKTAREQRASLGARIAELILVLPPGAPVGTVVTRDGEVVAEAGLGAPFLVDAGEHVVTTRAPDGPVTELRLTLAPGGKKAVALDVKRAGAPGGEVDPTAPRAAGGVNKTVVITGGVAAGAVVVGGALLGIFAYKKGSDADIAQAEHQGGCPPHGAGAVGACKTLSDTLHAHDALANAGLWTLVTGGTLGSFTLIYALTGRAKAPPTAARVLPVVTGNGGGLVVGGAF